MSHGVFLRSVGLGSIACLMFLPLGCHNSSSGGGGGDKHADIVLRDSLGQPLLAGSTTPFSPRQTCGQCHDIDLISQGYHHQQGRTDANGQIQVRDNFYNDGRNYVRSDGMYGKW